MRPNTLTVKYFKRKLLVGSASRCTNTDIFIYSFYYLRQERKNWPVIVKFFYCNGYLCINGESDIHRISQSLDLRVHFINKHEHSHTTHCLYANLKRKSMDTFTERNGEIVPVALFNKINNKKLMIKSTSPMVPEKYPRRRNLCMTCREKETKILYIPCGQAVSCIECAFFPKKTCPICEKEIFSLIRIYFWNWEQNWTRSSYSSWLRQNFYSNKLRNLF